MSTPAAPVREEPEDEPEDLTHRPRRGGLTEEQVVNLLEDVEALGHPLRLRLLHLLTKPHYSEEMAEVLDTTRQNAHRHVQRLEKRGFVRALNGWRTTGPVVEYQVVPSKLYGLGATIQDLGGLTPVGGPDVKDDDRTVVLDGEGRRVDRADARASLGHLLVLNGPTAGSRVHFDAERDRITIGRGEDRDVSLPHDPYVSSLHAEVQRDDHQLRVLDVRSANGTFVNLTRIPRGGSVPLRVGDVIGVGHALLVYHEA